MLTEGQTRSLPSVSSSFRIKDQIGGKELKKDFLSTRSKAAGGCMVNLK